jgi:hypothetical protein
VKGRTAIHEMDEQEIINYVFAKYKENGELKEYYLDA